MTRIQNILLEVMHIANHYYYRAPVFVEKLRANLTDEGMVSFECKVVGFPTPVLTWLKDGKDLRPGDVYQLYGNQSIGVYTCVARNCMGEARCVH